MTRTHDRHVELAREEVLEDWKYYAEPAYYRGHVLNFLNEDGDNLTVEVVANKGGLIQSFKLDNKSIFTNRAWPDQMDGSVFWPSPQSLFTWPPPRTIDPGTYKVKANESILDITLTSQVDPKLPLQMVKRLSVDEASRALVLDYEIKNMGNETRSYAPWQVSRVPENGLTFFMTGSHPPFHGNYDPLEVKSIGGATWFQHKAGTSNNSKLFADTASGWLAHTDGDLLFVNCFAKIPYDAMAPGEGQIEIYDGKGYVEVELQGPYQEVAPGDSLQWQVLWRLRRLPARALPAEAGNEELRSFAAETCSG